MSVNHSDRDALARKVDTLRRAIGVSTERIQKFEQHGRPQALMVAMYKELESNKDRLATAEAELAAFGSATVAPSPNARSPPSASPLYVVQPSPLPPPPGPVPALATIAPTPTRSNHVPIRRGVTLRLATIPVPRYDTNRLQSLKGVLSGLMGDIPPDDEASDPEYNAMEILDGAQPQDYGSDRDEDSDGDVSMLSRDREQPQSKASLSLIQDDSELGPPPSLTRSRRKSLALSPFTDDSASVDIERMLSAEQSIHLTRAHVGPSPSTRKVMTIAMQDQKYGDVGTDDIGLSLESLQLDHRRPKPARVQTNLKVDTRVDPRIIERMQSEAETMLCLVQLVHRELHLLRDVQRATGQRVPSGLDDGKIQRGPMDDIVECINRALHEIGVAVVSVRAVRYNGGHTKSVRDAIRESRDAFVVSWLALVDGATHLSSLALDNEPFLPNLRIEEGSILASAVMGRLYTPACGVNRTKADVEDLITSGRLWSQPIWLPRDKESTMADEVASLARAMTDYIDCTAVIASRR